MDEAITEAKRALVAEDRVANSDHYEYGERMQERLVHLARAQAHATVAVAIGLDRLLDFLDECVIRVRDVG